MTETAPPGAREVFGGDLGRAMEFAGLLAEHGVERGLIGPREVERLWERHLLNSAVLTELLPRTARVVDLGSGAGLPGVPLALAAPDLEITLLEPMARRVEWLEYVATTLGLGVAIIRGRAEEPVIRRRLGGTEFVVARAVAPLAKLCEWALPLLDTGGYLLAMKGAGAADEVTRDRELVARLGGGEPRIESCGMKVVNDPATVVIVEKVGGPRARRSRKDR